MKPRKPRTVWVIAVNGHALWAYRTKKAAQVDLCLEGEEMFKCVEVLKTPRHHRGSRRLLATSQNPLMP